ncbi:MAG: DUF4290 domain-containing protein [Bacteroidota bacterium]
MKYNISDTPLRLREYGRNVQSMVEYAKTVEDREHRTRVSHAIVQIMSNLLPSIRQEPDYKQKLWDHLHLISNFELDVDCPYPIPPKEIFENKPTERIPYYKGSVRYRQYGLNTQMMIRKAAEMEDGPEKKAYINVIANAMKQFIRNTELYKDNGIEDIIVNHMREISRGKIDLKPTDIRLTKSHFNTPNGRASNLQTHMGSQSKKKKNRKNNRRKK